MDGSSITQFSLKIRYWRTVLCLLVVSYFSLFAAFSSWAVLPIPTDCQIDLQGANDEPGQKDLTQLCTDLGDNSPFELHTLWNWDWQTCLLIVTCLVLRVTQAYTTRVLPSLTVIITAVFTQMGIARQEPVQTTMCLVTEATSLYAVHLLLPRVCLLTAVTTKSYATRISICASNRRVLRTARRIATVLSRTDVHCSGQARGIVGRATRRTRILQAAKLVLKLKQQ